MKTTTEEQLRAYTIGELQPFVQHYADAKTSVVHEILARARRREA
jgi:hypothetical protein